MNEILWGLLNFMFFDPLKIIAIMFTIVVILPMTIFVLIATARQNHYSNTSSHYGGVFVEKGDYDVLSYSEVDEFDSKSPVKEMIDEQLALEDEERYFGMDYGFLDEVEHLSDY